MPARRRVVKGRRALIFLAFALAYFFSNFFRSANAIIADDLTRDFSLTAGSLGLMTSVFYYVFAAVQIPLGAGLDRWGPRLVTSGLMLVAGLGSLVFSLAAGLGELLVGRALIGAGMGGVLMGAYTAFSRWYSPARFATMSGLLVGMGALGSLATGAPLAWAAAAIGWRAVFAAAAVGVAVSALLVALLVRNAPGRREVPLSPASPASSSAAVKVAPSVDVPLRPGLRVVVGDPRFRRIALLNFFMVGTLLSMQGLWSGPYLFEALGYSRSAAGTIITLAAVGGLAGYFSCGWLFDHVGRRFAVGVGAGALLVSEAALIVAALVQARWLAYPAFIALGFGGAYNILMMAHTRRVFPAAVMGRAVTAVNLFGIGGAALLQWLMGLIINLFPRSAAGRYPPEAYACALTLALVGGAGALVWYYISDTGFRGMRSKSPRNRRRSGGEAREKAEAVVGVEEGGATCDARPSAGSGRVAGGGLSDQDRPGDHYQGQRFRFVRLPHVRRQRNPGSDGAAGRGRHFLGAIHQHP
ncbi:MAG: MFS transporter [Gaiellales bacterium]|nr:MFS transporter [Gaiellales bacterium]